MLTRRFLGGCTLVHVGTGGRLLVLWILEFWLRTSRRVDTTMEQVVTNLKQQLGAQQQAIQQLSTMLENQQASSAERENALQAQLSDMLERWNRDATDVEARPGVEPEHGTPRRHRAFIESRAFSKLVNFDSKAASWKDSAFKFENMAAAVVPSRDAFDWAAQQDTPILNVDDVEDGPRFCRNQSSSLRCTGRASGRRGIGHCAEHDTRRRFGCLAETREKV